MKYNVTVYSFNADRTQTLINKETFTSKTLAREFAEEELSWESTSRVVCKELDIDEEGDFVR